MNRLLIIILEVVLILVMGHYDPEMQDVKNTYNANMMTYYEMNDGSWTCEGHTYKYRLEITGRLHNAVRDTTYVYLSNIPDITFEQAWKAGGLSSNSDDYFSPEDAVLVELK
ncbi:MAG: immunogenic protein [Oscillospiraceae bacterium]|nr:immunogenic protein [Oscillospiraceae bacterium]